MLDLPHDYELDLGDLHALLVEDSASKRHLRQLSSVRRRGHEFCDIYVYQWVPHAGVELAIEIRSAQFRQLWANDLHSFRMPPEWLIK
jgi:hypothetical protein